MASTPSSPDAPLFTNFLLQGGKALVSVLETNLIAPALDAEAEAERLRHTMSAEAEAQASSIAPWQTLAEQYSILEDELKVRILRLSESEDNFTSQIAAEGRRRPGNILPGCLPMANAALAEDANLRALRFKVVPARLSEEEFWRCYFWHVANVKCEMLHDWRTANGARRTVALEEERTLAPVEGEEELSSAPGGDGTAQSEAAATEAVDDLDAEFERLVGTPTPK